MHATRNLHRTTIETPIGDMLAVADETGLMLLEFTDRPGLQGEIDRLEAIFGTTAGKAMNDVLKATAQQLRAYFSGGGQAFEIHLELIGTEFECAVWESVRTIAWGETKTYAQVAAGIGKPRAIRAAGRANGRNPLAIVIPCHRVIGSDGGLHGYGGGLWRKEWLLAHEQGKDPSPNFAGR